MLDTEWADLLVAASNGGIAMEQLSGGATIGAEHRFAYNLTSNGAVLDLTDCTATATIYNVDGTSLGALTATLGDGTGDYNLILDLPASVLSGLSAANLNARWACHLTRAGAGPAQLWRAQESPFPIRTESLRSN